VKTARIDEIEPLDLNGVRWRPLRRTLGVRAFGVNVMEADAGAAVVHEHDETESGAGAQRHEELYVVLAGAAEFTVDADTVAASAGTLVFVPDPAARRGARALADGTRLLAIGGPVDEAYRPPPWEAWFEERA
jgi:mannose-6-phosphate isomerase-like protein (cupin superfamily)